MNINNPPVFDHIVDSGGTSRRMYSQQVTGTYQITTAGAISGPVFQLNPAPPTGVLVSILVHDPDVAQDYVSSFPWVKNSGNMVLSPFYLPGDGHVGFTVQAITLPTATTSKNLTVTAVWFM